MFDVSPLADLSILGLKEPRAEESKEGQEARVKKSRQR